MHGSANVQTCCPPKVHLHPPPKPACQCATGLPMQRHAQQGPVSCYGHEKWLALGRTCWRLEPRKHELPPCKNTGKDAGMGCGQAGCAASASGRKALTNSFSLGSSRPAYGDERPYLASSSPRNVDVDSSSSGPTHDAA